MAESSTGPNAKPQVRETAGHVAAAYSSDAAAPQVPRSTDPPEAPVVLSDSLILSRELVPAAPITPPDPEAITQPIPKDVVAEAVRRNPNAVAARDATETPPANVPPADLTLPTAPPRRVNADVGGDTVLVPRTRPASVDDRRRMKWIVAVATIALGVFALAAFLGR